MALSTVQVSLRSTNQTKTFRHVCTVTGVHNGSSRLPLRYGQMSPQKTVINGHYIAKFISIEIIIMKRREGHVHPMMRVPLDLTVLVPTRITVFFHIVDTRY